jgi:hypothetical protein
MTGRIDIETPNALYAYFGQPVDLWKGWFRFEDYIKEKLPTDNLIDSFEMDTAKEIYEAFYLLNLVKKSLIRLKLIDYIREGPYVKKLSKEKCAPGGNLKFVFFKKGRDRNTIVISPHLSKTIHGCTLFTALRYHPKTDTYGSLKPYG